jgi:orotate phosphoribosyltransferase
VILDKAIHSKDSISMDTSNTSDIEGVKDFVYQSSAWKAAEALINTRSYRIDMKLDPINYYQWKSGIKAPCYCNCRDLNGHPTERISITRSLTESIKTNFTEVDIIIGVPTAGLSWAGAVADQLNLPLAYVRSSAKPHGLGGLVECSPKPGMKAVIVDDLVASGGSLKQVISALNDEVDVQVIGIQSIVNWGFPSMRNTLKNLRVRSLTSFPWILYVAKLQGYITHSQCDELMNFYKDPENHIWSHQKDS